MDRQRVAEVLSIASDEARFAEVHEQWRPAIRAYFARRTLSARIDDAVADTSLVAWRRIDEVPTTGTTPRSPPAWTSLHPSGTRRSISGSWRRSGSTTLFEHMLGVPPTVE